jgi:hypothetical protein
VTGLLVAWRRSDEQALERLLPLVYRELHRAARAAMRGERSGHTLEPTALINEADLRLVAPPARLAGPRTLSGGLRAPEAPDSD